jgi:DNA (cytosine-5)-methyltransferase 3A
MIKVLSLFDGISGARQALKELNIDCEYYGSEIDKYAIQVAKNNHPDIIHIGDVKGIEFEDGYIFYNQNNDPMKNGGSFKNNIDLLIGGSPCQDLSIAKKDRKGLNGERSSLFYEYLRILNRAKPKYFILENVNSMKKEWRDKISKLLGVEPIMINSALLTAQMRKRLYWTNIPNIQQPQDKNVVLKDIIESGDTERLKSYCITATYSRACPEDYFNHGQRQLIFKKPVRIGYFNKGGQGDRIYSVDGKSVCLSANGGGRGAKTGLYQIKDLVRKLTPNECARLQGFPDNYCQGISNTQAYKCFGNSFTVPVIKHILQQLNLF